MITSVQQGAPRLDQLFDAEISNEYIGGSGIAVATTPYEYA